MKRDRLMGFGQVMTMPLFFASNALYPVKMMPGWLSRDRGEPALLRGGRPAGDARGHPGRPRDGFLALALAVAVAVTAASSLVNRLAR